MALQHTLSYFGEGIVTIVNILRSLPEGICVCITGSREQVDAQLQHWCAC